MTTTTHFKVDETTLVFAFRYALGRESTAPSHMVDQLSLHWRKLAGWTQHQIRGEIARAIHRGMAGRQCDVDRWSTVLTWDTKEEPPRFEGRMDEDGYTGTDGNAHS